MQTAAKYAGTLCGGEVIALSGTLGSGKTHFVKGLAAELGITDRVNSPTFNILHEYSGGRLKLYHFDMYRIGESELVDVGYFEAISDNGVTVIEWAENISNSLPDNTIFIGIEVTGENSRIIRIEKKL